ncbi:MAG: hypothetical protein GY733_03580 [bacterium]|nr:hypothetical protein [bacterium]
MEARANIIEESFERVQERFRNAGEEFQRLQDRASKNRRKLSERTQARAEKMQQQLLEIPAIKAADDFRLDLRKQVETTVEEIMARLPVASGNDVAKLERRVKALTRRVRNLEKAES